MQIKIWSSRMDCVWHSPNLYSTKWMESKKENLYNEAGDLSIKLTGLPWAGLSTRKQNSSNEHCKFKANETSYCACFLPMQKFLIIPGTAWNLFSLSIPCHRPVCVCPSETVCWYEGFHGPKNPLNLPGSNVWGEKRENTLQQRFSSVVLFAKTTRKRQGFIFLSFPWLFSISFLSLRHEFYLTI